MRLRWLFAALLVLAGLTVAEPALANHGQDLDCSDFEFREDAQAHVDAHAGDPDDLDGDDADGLACETLPSREQTATTTTQPAVTTTTRPAVTTTTTQPAVTTTTRPAVTTTTRPAATTTTRPASSCHPSYAGACVPVAEDVDCPGGTGDGPAFAPSENLQVVGDDVYDLDRDNDGIACESGRGDDRPGTTGRGGTTLARTGQTNGRTVQLAMILVVFGAALLMVSRALLVSKRQLD